MPYVSFCRLTANSCLLWRPGSVLPEGWGLPTPRPAGRDSERSLGPSWTLALQRSWFSGWPGGRGDPPPCPQPPGPPLTVLCVLSSESLSFPGGVSPRRGLARPPHRTGRAPDGVQGFRESEPGALCSGLFHCGFTCLFCWNTCILAALLTVLKGDLLALRYSAYLYIEYLENRK